MSRLETVMQLFEACASVDERRILLPPEQGQADDGKRRRICVAVQRRLAIRLIAAYESKDLAVPKALSNFQPGRSKKTLVPKDFWVSTVKDHTLALSKQGIEIVADSDLLVQFFKASGGGVGGHGT